jgi:hypothetical protein
VDKFFQYLNTFPLPLWLAMMFAPRHPLTDRAARSSTIFGLSALHYLLALIIAIRSGEGGETSLNDFNSLDGVNKLIGHRAGTLAAWAHMLALDLFTGGWIYRQCRRLNAPAWVRIPSLFFTLMSGPFGLLLFLLWRTFGARKGEALAGVDMGTSV